MNEKKSVKTKKSKSSSGKKQQQLNKTPKVTPEEFFNSIEPKPEYVKHMIECQCFLPQFKNLPTSINHKFVVFSELDDRGMIKPSYAMCNNCSLVYKVTEIGVANPIGKESSNFIESVDDIEVQLPERIGKILKQHDCDLHVWQEAKFIVDHEMWGRFVVLAKERTSTNTGTIGKVCQILGRDLIKIESFEIEEVASNI